MSGPIAAVPVPELTSGAQLFRCLPYSCTMLARACVERQAKAELGLDAITLLKCKGCALGAEVKQRASDVVLLESDLLRAARANGHHRGGALGKKLRGVKFNPAPPEAAPVAAASPTPPVLTAPPVAQQPPSPREKERMPNVIDLTGKKTGGFTVLRRAPSVGSVTYWRVKHQQCSHEEDIPATSVAYCETNGSKRRCKQCRVETEPAAKPTKPPRARPTAEAPNPRELAPPPKRPPPARSVSRSGDSLAHEFPLRRDFTARLELPSDLSKSDVTRLSRWLDVLVFEEGGE